MIQESVQPILSWVTAHPTWAGFIVFLISLSESLAIVGLVVPGVVMMTAIGGMMGSGHLPFVETLSWAILGAIAGDGLSYWLGYHYHDRLRNFWPFKQFPKLLARGEAFFRSHGGKSIIFGRFVGPVRPMIPVIAGMMDMTPKRFLVFNILSAIAWAPLYSLPGILIGLSLGTLSSEAASRVGLLVLLFLLSVWVIYEILFWIGAWFIRTLKSIIDKIWKVLNHIAGFDFVFKTTQGSGQTQLAILILFLLASAGFAITLQDVLNADGIAAWNEPVYQALRALYNTEAIHWVGILTGLGDPMVLFPGILTIGAWLFWHQHFKAGACWLLTITAAFVIGAFTKVHTAIARPEGVDYLSHSFAFPSVHALMATVTFGLAAALIHRSLPRRYRFIPWVIVLPLILVVSLSRVYLGIHWFTDVVGGVSLGTACAAFGFFVYRRLSDEKPLAETILMPGLVALTMTFSFYAYFMYPNLKSEYIRQWPSHTLEEKTWWQGMSETNGLYRTGAFKRQATVFDVQWLGSLDHIAHHLKNEGWTFIPKLNVKTGVILLANHPSPLLFPAMPKFHRDRLPVLSVVKEINQNQRLVLQLWRSDYQTPTGTPLWVGTLRTEETAHPIPLMTFFLEQPESNALLNTLKKEAKSMHLETRIISAEGQPKRKILLLR